MTSAALILWPFVSLFFFLRMSVPAAVAATIIGGYLLLPAQGGFNLPMLPAVGKGLVASMSALVWAFVFAKRNAGFQPGLLPRSPVVLVLLGLLILGAFGTAFTNSEAIVTGGPVLPGLRPYDAISTVANTMVGLLPFLLARKYLATPESHRTLLIVFVVAGFGYSMLALYEIRMSPQLNQMLYGYFPHSWRQHVRDGGFRPVVFLNHALWLAIFLSCCALAAFALWRIGGSKWRPAFLGVGLWLLVTLVLAKNFGAVVITFMLLPMVLLLPFRLQILAAAALATMLTLYPVLRAGGMVPIDFVVENLRKISPDRIGSLEFRLRHEDMLLEKANEKPLFGWGGYSRSRLYDENGRDLSTVDGEWIITFSQGGWVRYVGDLGLLTFGIFALALRWRRYELDPATAALSVVLAANLLDLIPNATSTSVTLVIAGALAGRLEILTQPSGARLSAQAPEGAPRGGLVSASGAVRSAPAGSGVTAEGQSAASLGPRFTRFPAGPVPRQRTDLG